jgi:cytosine/adenosine deaminase-related metal-dependent hydrolase
MAYNIYLDNRYVLSTAGNRIAGEPVAGATSLYMDNAIVYPGLINSHDHLDFNCFPTLANRRYKDYTEWGRDIHHTHTDTISAVIKIPVALRFALGWYKNLLNGITTVVHHGRRYDNHHAGIRILQTPQSIHSVGFDRLWRIRLLSPFAANPVVAHCGEGVNAAAHLEISKLLGMNWWKRPIVGVHGVAMTVAQARRFKAVVWCPASNLFLLGQTAPVTDLATTTTLLFGTDSTLTAPWALAPQLQQAADLQVVTDEALFRMLTVNAAAVWGLPGKGRLEPGADADLVVTVKRPGLSFYKQVFASEPEDLMLVIQEGHIRLYDAGITAQLNGLDQTKYEPVQIGNRTKFVPSGIRQILESIHQYCPSVNLPIH